MSVADLCITVAHGSDDVRKDLVEAINGRHRVIGVCGTVAELKQLVTEQRPDLLITGVRFPDGNGIDTAIELGNDHPIATVIATSARSLQLVEQAMADHVMAYLIEPVSQEELSAAIIVAWSRFQQLQELREEVADLKTALGHRKIIERAKGVLMASQNLTEAEAFSALRTRAQNERRRMIDVANDLLGQA